MRSENTSHGGSKHARVQLQIIGHFRKDRAKACRIDTGSYSFSIFVDTNDRSCYCLLMTQAASTRDRILEQGLALMSQAGLAGVTLGVLADQVGMSKSGLFAHFKSKEEVQIELLEHSSEVGA